MDDMPAGLFAIDSGCYVPDPICAGPWDPGAMHGGPIAALLARLTVAHGGTDDEWFLSRLTVELIRPVPVAPLQVNLELRRPGKRVQLIDAVVLDPDGVEVLLARGLRIRHRDNGLDETTLVHPGPPPYPLPESLPAFADRDDRPFARDRRAGEFFMDAVVLRPVRAKEFVGAGPAQVWFKLLVPVFAGEQIHPIDRAVTAADFPNGVSRVVDPQHHGFINPDLSINFHRYPEGEWVLLDAVTHARRGCYGTAQAQLWDERGQLGMSVQSLLVAPTAGAR